MRDKYGIGQDPHCYPGSTVLRNRLGLTDDQALDEAERTLSEIAANKIDFDLPPYDLPYLQRIHQQLFADVYDWAGELRTVDISKRSTHFCNLGRVEVESAKLFKGLADAGWFEGLSRSELVAAAAELYGDLTAKVTDGHSESCSSTSSSTRAMRSVGGQSKKGNGFRQTSQQ